MPQLESFSEDLDEGMLQVAKRTIWYLARKHSTQVRKEIHSVRDRRSTDDKVYLNMDVDKRYVPEVGVQLYVQDKEKVIRKCYGSRKRMTMDIMRLSRHLVSQIFADLDPALLNIIADQWLPRAQTFFEERFEGQSNAFETIAIFRERIDALERQIRAGCLPHRKL